VKERAVKVCVITGFGINADEELAQAFGMAGAEADRVHVSDLIEEPGRVLSYNILAFPGGFSFGDHLGSGKVFAILFKRNLKTVMEEFVASGGLVIGICNGFQVLVKMGLLPNLSGGWQQEVSLIHNDSGKFEDRWVRVSFDPASPCLWTRGLAPMDLQVRHGEGKFVVRSTEVLKALESRRLAVARYSSRDGTPAAYPDNPNGSVAAIAGICDPSGRIFGIMPHPEAFLFPQTHPDWARERIAWARDRLSPRETASADLPPGLAFIRGGVVAARESS
jgi:phosphoribosylformylglycinamidine synthase I